MRRLKLSILVALAGVSLALAACQAPAEPPADTAAADAAAPAADPAPAAEAPAAEAAPAAEGAPAAEAPAAEPERPRFVAPIRGEAEIGYLKPVVKVEGDTVVTTIQMKNLSNGAIAGLRVEEFWWDRNNNPLPADSQRLSKPLMPQEVAEIVLRTPRSGNMARNSYKFSHANGDIKTQLLTSMEP